MRNLSALYADRIGYPEETQVTFETLNRLLERASLSIPFENLAVMEKRTDTITIENLIRKVIERKEGGLCYELNTLLCHVLRDSGFDVRLARGIVYDPESGTYAATGRTHVTILLQYEGGTYLVDTGFGGNLPLRPVPLTGETVSSANGEFRVVRSDSAFGDCLFEMKLRHKHDDWVVGYAFDSRRPVAEPEELDEIQQAIAEHPQSNFRKQPLMTRRTESGSVTLTGSSITRWEDGVVTKEAVEGTTQFEALRKRYFEAN